jgi:seryl-tRNA synthetase
MWNSEKQERLDELQQQSLIAGLPEDDQHALNALLSELEQAEWSTLQPALSGLRHSRNALASDLGQLQAQNAVVAALAGRYADLLARAKAQLAGLESERETLRREYVRALH